MLSESNLFFKYRSFTEATMSYLMDMLNKNEVYFPRRSSFNDPFDSRVRPVFEGSEDEWKTWFAGALVRRRPELSEEERLRFVEDMIRKERFKSVPDSVGADFPDRAGIFCMSRCHDHLLMWSHYAESHTGLCVAFDADNEFFGRAQQIEYAKDYPHVSYLHESQDVVTTAMLLTKADVWAYEKEWRIIDHNNGPGSYTFPSDSLKVVILGCRMPTQSRHLVQQWCNMRKPRPRIFQAQMADRQFALEFKEVTEGN